MTSTYCPASTTVATKLAFIPCPVPAGGSWDAGTWFDGMPAAIFAAVYSALGFDPDRLGLCSLDNKLVQADTLSRYIPELVPRTVGLLDCVGPTHLRDVRRRLAEYFPEGFVVKPARGAGSGDVGRFDRSRDVERLVARQRRVTGISDGHERWVVQQRISIIKEYRLHTVERRVVRAVSGERYHFFPTLENCDVAATALEAALACLPALIIEKTMWGWDVAQTDDGRFVIIEGNVIGNHHVVMPGFHCSGFFGDPINGPDLMAALLRDMRIHYNLAFPTLVIPPPLAYRRYCDRLLAQF